MDPQQRKADAMKSHTLNQSLITRLKENVLAPGGLFHLDLSCSNVGPRELYVLGEIIKANGLNCEGSAPLLTIDLSNNVLCGVTNLGRGNYDTEGLNDFVTCMISLRSVSRLKRLDFSRNYLQTKGMNIISNMLSSNLNSLSELILKNCQLNAESIEKLMNILLTNKSIQYLDLSENILGSIGGRYIGDALIGNTRLKHLLLNNCDLLADGVIPIFHALHTNNNLEILSLNINGFGDTGAEALGNMLKNNGKLRHLDIQENCIGVEGISAIAKGITKNHSLYFLGLQWNDVTNDAAAKIGEALSLNNTLGVVNVLGNHVDVEGIKAIILGSLTGNTKLIDLDLGHCYRPPGKGKAQAERKVIKELPKEMPPAADAATTVSNNTGASNGQKVKQKGNGK